MRTFVTGGTGFIGRRLVRQLIARGDQVNALARSEQGAADLLAWGANPIPGDLDDLQALRAGMAGCEVVFHLAGWYKLGAPDQHSAEHVNVEGTRRVLTLAWRLGIPRIVYTSTIAIYGDTDGKLVDETYTRQDLIFASEYERTKSLAYFQVVQPLIAQGAPVVILLPGVVYGPGDHSLVSELMNLFWSGLLAVFPGPETLLSYCHVEDVAAGHILAAEKGRPGESYNLTGPTLSLRGAAGLWASVSGKPAPLVYVPARWLRPLAPLAAWFNSHIPWPAVFSADGVKILGISYAALAYKARKELGWETRPLVQGFQETFAAWAARHQTSHSKAVPKGTAVKDPG